MRRALGIIADVPPAHQAAHLAHLDESEEDARGAV